MPKEHAERIFQLFQRAVGREVEGTGAGLAIVRQISERHGGNAWVEQREGGVGCELEHTPVEIDPGQLPADEPLRVRSERPRRRCRNKPQDARGGYNPSSTLIRPLSAAVRRAS